MKPNAIIQTLLSIVIFILGGLLTWALTEINTLKEKDSEALLAHMIDDAELDKQLALMQTSMNMLMSDKETDDGQNRQLQKQWIIMNKHKDWINELRTDADLPSLSWPDHLTAP